MNFLSFVKTRIECIVSRETMINEGGCGNFSCDNEAVLKKPDKNEKHELFSSNSVNVRLEKIHKGNY